ncbi:MAG: response regulator [Desulfosarcinaceae bacterium]|jgi:DNA-binding response OmpR family regulator
MLKILLATPQQDRFERLRSELVRLHPFHFSHAADGQAALDAVLRRAVDLVIVDEALGDMSGLGLVRRLLGVNALINTVLVSTESPEDFHEHTEGLGVLMPLPENCGAVEAAGLAEALRGLGMLTETG